MFFERYKLLCAHKGVTPSKASEEIGFSKGLVSHWHKNYKQGVDVKPGMEIAKMMAEYFNVSLDYLLGHNMTDPLLELGKQHTPTHTLRDRTPIALIQDPVLTDRELLLIDAYRRHPELQALVDQAMGLVDTNEDEKA